MLTPRCRVCLGLLSSRTLPVCAGVLMLSGFAEIARSQIDPSLGKVGVSSPATADGADPGQGAEAATAGSLAGTVLDSTGAVVVGAKVALSLGGAPARSVATDKYGTFTFRTVPPGPFSVSVTLSGFTRASASGELQAGQDLTLVPFTLAVATVAITVNAVTQEQMALEELHTEEHQRLAGVLPNFFVSYNWTAPPLTSKQKFSLAWHDARDPGNLALVGTVAAVQQAANAFPGYRQGAAGYGKRYGADLANLWVGTYMGGAVLPSLFHQDPRYFYRGTGSIRSRVRYALSRSVLTRGDNGHEQPNFSGILGDLSAGAISNLYYPASDREGARVFLINGLLGIAGDAMNNIVQEFVFNHVTVRGKKPKSAVEITAPESN